MPGVPSGVTFDVGDVHYTGALTCFCAGDLCNSEHWCDTCQTSGVERSGFPGLTIVGLVLGAAKNLKAAIFLQARKTLILEVQE